MGADFPKALMAFDRSTIVARAVERASACSSVSGIIVVVAPGWETEVRKLLRRNGVDEVVAGGETRQDSVLAGLSAVPSGAERVICHDAARPLASTELFARSLHALEGWDGVVPVLRMVDTVKRVHDGRIRGTEPREALALAQTPQAFTAVALREAHERAARDRFKATDDALLLERGGYRVRAIEGERTNLKITSPEDLHLAEMLSEMIAR